MASPYSSYTNSPQSACDHPSGYHHHDNESADQIDHRRLHVKVLYSFDDQNQTKCLARLPTPRSLPVAQLEDGSFIGAIDLDPCIRAVVEASPELTAKFDHDYTVYAYDFSELDTPLVGQGRLSSVLGRHDLSAYDEPPKVTGRVCRNAASALFGRNSAETLEVRLKFVPVPKKEHQPDRRVCSVDASIQSQNANFATASWASSPATSSLDFKLGDHSHSQPDPHPTQSRPSFSSFEQDRPSPRTGPVRPTGPSQPISTGSSRPGSPSVTSSAEASLPNQTPESSFSNPPPKQNHPRPESESPSSNVPPEDGPRKRVRLEPAAGVRQQPPGKFGAPRSLWERASIQSSHLMGHLFNRTAEPDPDGPNRAPTPRPQRERQSVRSLSGSGFDLSGLSRMQTASSPGDGSPRRAGQSPGSTVEYPPPSEMPSSPPEFLPRMNYSTLPPNEDSGFVSDANTEHSPGETLPVNEPTRRVSGPSVDPAPAPELSPSQTFMDEREKRKADGKVKQLEAIVRRNKQAPWRTVSPGPSNLLPTKVLLDPKGVRQRQAREEQEALAAAAAAGVTESPGSFPIPSDHPIPLSEIPQYNDLAPQVNPNPPRLLPEIYPRPRPRPMAAHPMSEPCYERDLPPLTTHMSDVVPDLRLGRPSPPVQVSASSPVETQMPSPLGPLPMADLPAKKASKPRAPRKPKAKEPKEPKEPKEAKEAKEPKEAKETKAPKAPPKGRQKKEAELSAPPAPAPSPPPPGVPTTTASVPEPPPQLAALDVAPPTTTPQEMPPISPITLPTIPEEPLHPPETTVQIRRPQKAKPARSRTTLSRSNSMADAGSTGVPSPDWDLNTVKTSPALPTAVPNVPAKGSTIEQFDFSPFPPELPFPPPSSAPVNQYPTPAPTSTAPAPATNTAPTAATSSSSKTTTTTSSAPARAAPNSSTVTSGSRRKRTIRAQLITDVTSGSMPRFCLNCGEIEPTTWRKAYTRIEHGDPTENGVFVLDPPSTKNKDRDKERESAPGAVVGLEIVKHDPAVPGRVLQYRVWKRVLGPDEKILMSSSDEDETLYYEVIMCNPCGLWFAQKGSMRPESCWNKPKTKAEPKPKARPKGKKAGGPGGGGGGMVEPASEPIMPSMSEVEGVSHEARPVSGPRGVVGAGASAADGDGSGSAASVGLGVGRVAKSSAEGDVDMDLFGPTGADGQAIVEDSAEGCASDHTDERGMAMNSLSARRILFPSPPKKSAGVPFAGGDGGDDVGGLVGLPQTKSRASSKGAPATGGLDPPTTPPRTGAPPVSVPEPPRTSRGATVSGSGTSPRKVRTPASLSRRLRACSDLITHMGMKDSGAVGGVSNSALSVQTTTTAGGTLAANAAEGAASGGFGARMSRLNSSNTATTTTTVAQSMDAAGAGSNISILNASGGISTEPGLADSSLPTFDLATLLQQAGLPADFDIFGTDALTLDPAIDLNLGHPAAAGGLDVGNLDMAGLMDVNMGGGGGGGGGSGGTDLAGLEWKDDILFGPDFGAFVGQGVTSPPEIGAYSAAAASAAAAAAGAGVMSEPIGPPTVFPGSENVSGTGRYGILNRYDHRFGTGVEANGPGPGPGPSGGVGGRVLGRAFTPLVSVSQQQLQQLDMAHQQQQLQERQQQERQQRQVHTKQQQQRHQKQQHHLSSPILPHAPVPIPAPLAGPTHPPAPVSVQARSGTAKRVLVRSLSHSNLQPGEAGRGFRSGGGGGGSGGGGISGTAGGARVGNGYHKTRPGAGTENRSGGGSPGPEADAVKAIAAMRAVSGSGSGSAGANAQSSGGGAGNTNTSTNMNTDGNSSGNGNENGNGSGNAGGNANGNNAAAAGSANRASFFHMMPFDAKIDGRD